MIWDSDLLQQKIEEAVSNIPWLKRNLQRKPNKESPSWLGWICIPSEVLNQEHKSGLYPLISGYKMHTLYYKYPNNPVQKFKWNEPDARFDRGPVLAFMLGGHVSRLSRGLPVFGQHERGYVLGENQRLHWVEHCREGFTLTRFAQPIAGVDSLEGNRLSIAPDGRFLFTLASKDDIWAYYHIPLNGDGLPDGPAQKVLPLSFAYRGQDYHMKGPPTFSAPVGGRSYNAILWARRFDNDLSQFISYLFRFPYREFDGTFDIEAAKVILEDNTRVEGLSEPLVIAGPPEGSPQTSRLNVPVITNGAIAVATLTEKTPPKNDSQDDFIPGVSGVNRADGRTHRVRKPSPLDKNKDSSMRRGA
jgi:hypothetical protein